MSALTSQPDTGRETPRVRLHLDGWHDRPSGIETIERIRRRLQQGVPVDGIFDDLEMALGPDGDPGRDDIGTLIIRFRGYLMQTVDALLALAAREGRAPSDEEGALIGRARAQRQEAPDVAQHGSMAEHVLLRRLALTTQDCMENLGEDYEE
ncbi:DUF6415 family natural product biosynthesis protein [Streptomyces sp. NPDC059349]|uniref:DUF6415 family natural product biosynthesis protein n=1 Tax=Streptomyces sp. NPDC059349 TaxID=3346808 RepID=UPI00368F4F81